MEALFRSSRQTESRLVAAAREPDSAFGDSLPDVSMQERGGATTAGSESASDTPQPVPLSLPERLDTRAAAGLAKALLACRGQTLVLDASSVRFVGGRCAELLVAAALAGQESGQRLRVLDPSDDFVSGLAQLGLFGLLADLGTDAAKEVSP